MTKLVINNKKFNISFFYKYLEDELLMQEGIKYNIENDELVLENDKKEDFIQLLRKMMTKLLIDFYMEPNQKKRSKYPGRYQKIYFNNHVYVLDYRTNVKDMALYNMYILLEEITKIAK